jgi:ribose-phosphate pyrophosphokinase
LQAGATKVYACATHAVLSGDAIDRIAHSGLEQVIVTNTIPLTERGKAEPKIKVLSVAGLVARAIQSIHEETSISRLFA